MAMDGNPIFKISIWPLTVSDLFTCKILSQILSFGFQSNQWNAQQLQLDMTTSGQPFSVYNTAGPHISKYSIKFNMQQVCPDKTSV